MGKISYILVLYFPDETFHNATKNYTRMNSLQFGNEDNVFITL